MEAILDATPKLSRMSTPTPKHQRSRWDETPATMGSTTPGSAIPAAAYTPGVISFDGLDLATPTPGPIQIHGALTPEQYILARHENDTEYKIMKLLLEVRNGTPPQRNTAFRQLTDKARESDAGPLFNCIFLLLMNPFLEDQDKHLFKVIDRVVYNLGELVRPYVDIILVMIAHKLSYEEYRVEAREIISSLSKAAGLATMIAAMHPDIDNYDESMRNTTARAFSVVASALGIPALLPFLKVVCQSKKSWRARHAGIKIVQEIAILIGCAVLPHLRSLVEIIGHGLNDENREVRKITALSLAVLAEVAGPYGIESFDSVLKPLLMGIRSERGKVLAAFLKAIGFIIPLMDAKKASDFTKELMVILTPGFQSSPDEKMKKIVLDVVQKLHVLDCDEYDEYDGWLSIYLNL